MQLAYERRVESRLHRECGDLGCDPLTTQWGSKLNGHAIRIAGLLHLADHLDDPAAWADPISPQEMHRATKLADYFAEHAKHALDLMGADESFAVARIVLNYLRRHQIETFTSRDLLGNLSPRSIRQMDILRPALELLEAHDWVQPTKIPMQRKPGPGRPPSPSYRVHPAVHADKKVGW